MAEATAFDVINSIESLLDANLDDPNTKSADNRDWIITEELKLDVGDFPRIHINKANRTDSGRGINSEKREYDQRIQITILYNVLHEWDVDGDNENEENENEALDYYDDEISRLINTNQDRWQGLGTNIDCLLTLEGRPVAVDKKNVVGWAIDCGLKFAR